MATRRRELRDPSPSPPPRRAVALLRGINVGRAKRVAMADLRRVFEDLGHRDVATIRNSGNVVFTAGRALGEATARALENAVATELGVESRITLLALADVERIAERSARKAPEGDPSRTLIAVARVPATWKALHALGDESWEPESVAFGAGWALLHCPQGIAHSRLVQAFERVARGEVTMRNLATWQLLLAKAREHAG